MFVFKLSLSVASTVQHDPSLKPAPRTKRYAVIKTREDERPRPRTTSLVITMHYGWWICMKKWRPTTLWQYCACAECKSTGHKVLISIANRRPRDAPLITKSSV